MKKINILITGCAGDIGLSIANIIKHSDIANKIIGCDINDDFPHHIIFDFFEKIHPVSSALYLEQLKDLIFKYDIDIIIPASEIELRFFCENKITNIANKPLIMSDLKTMEIGFDKYKTYEFLKANDMPYPKTYLLNDNQLEFPYILKDRKGAGNTSVYLINNQEDYNYYSKKHPDAIVQEFLSGEEYTCGVFRTKAIDTRTIIFSRRLQGGGHTVSGRVVSNKAIENVLRDVAKNIDLDGCINIQLRCVDGIPFIFEINPRFSSTVGFRHKIGFSDLIWSIYKFLNIDIPNYNSIKKDVKIFRISEEIIY